MKDIRLKDDQLTIVQKNWIEEKTRDTYCRQRVDLERFEEYIERMGKNLKEAESLKKIDPYYLGAMKYFVEALKEVAESMAINKSDLAYIHWWAVGTLSVDPDELTTIDWHDYDKYNYEDEDDDLLEEGGEEDE